MLRRLPSILLLCVPLAACQSLSKTDEASRYSHTYLEDTLKPGVTTQADVRRLYGEPDSVQSSPSGPWLWVYYSDKGEGHAFSYALRNLGLSTLLGDTPTGPGLSPTLFLRFEGQMLAQYVLEKGRYQSAPIQRLSEPALLQ